MSCSQLTELDDRILRCRL